MMHRRGFLMLILAGGLLTGCSTPRPARYFFVVPEELPSGQSSQAERGRLESWLVERAGGFTEFEGVRGGWRAPDGAIVTERNRGYLVTVPPGQRSFQDDLRRYIIDRFEQQEAYIERW